MKNLYLFVFGGWNIPTEQEPTEVRSIAWFINKHPGVTVTVIFARTQKREPDLQQSSDSPENALKYQILSYLSPEKKE